MSDLGVARGKIVIDTSDLRRAQNEVQAASRGMSQALNALGIGLGARELVQYAVASDQIATAYRRQLVAAESLAGGQARLNQLLETYDETTGGAISRATALADVTRLMAVGFADSTDELERFTRAARGISVATGASQDYVISQLTLAIANQSTARLDQLGLEASEVKQRIDELKAANKGMSDGMAYQTAILDIAGEKFGALADSAEAGATGMENLRKEWDNLMLSLGGGPVDFVAQAMAEWLKQAKSDVDTVKDAVQQLEDAFDRLRYKMGFRNNMRPDLFGSPSRTSIGRVTPEAFGTGEAAPRFDEAQTAAITDWWRGVQDIERQAARDRLEATRQYEQQRTDAIRQYERTIAREAQDFALQRARAEEDYAISLQRTHRDIAQREARQLEDLERTISEARLDAAERASERQAAYEENVAETRAAANERILEMEADFARSRERAQRNFAERLRDAAANLDAVRVRELQREYRNSQRDAQEDFDTRIERERKNEAKRLADLEKAYNKQTASEAAALQKRIEQANAAYQRQLEDARAADSQRLEDQAADYALRIERENEDRALRLERLAQDHQDQLGEMATQHENRLIQISDHAREERDLLDEEFGRSLEDLKIYVDKYITESERATNQAIAQFDRWLEHVNQAFAGVDQGPYNRPSPWNGPVFGGAAPVVPSSVSNSTSSRTLSVAPGAIVIYGDGLNEQQVGDVVLQKMAEFLDEYSN